MVLSVSIGPRSSVLDAISSTREIAGEKRGRLVSSARASPPIARERTRETSGSLGSYRNTAGAIGRSFWLASWPSHKKKNRQLFLTSPLSFSLLFSSFYFFLYSNPMLSRSRSNSRCSTSAPSARPSSTPRARWHGRASGFASR